MKAVHGYVLINVRSPDYLYNQAVYWVWSMAEPNVTIISASIPVLRGFVSQVRKRTESSPGAGAYIKTGDASGRFYNQSTVTATRGEPRDHDASSDSSILVSEQQGSSAGGGGGITWTTQKSVEYAPRLQTEHRIEAADKNAPKDVSEFEMKPIDHRKGGA
ncbi:hypothetical protein SGCOL_004402 [Colletotrichum sp. CLE4]